MSPTSYQTAPPRIKTFLAAKTPLGTSLLGQTDHLDPNSRVCIIGTDPSAVNRMKDEKHIIFQVLLNGLSIAILNLARWRRYFTEHPLEIILKPLETRKASHICEAFLLRSVPKAGLDAASLVRTSSSHSDDYIWCRRRDLTRPAWPARAHRKAMIVYGAEGGT
jgi:hypothetical protein